MNIYLDNAATTPQDPRVWSKMHQFHFNEHGYANSSSVHALGIKASSAIEKTRGIVASSVSAPPEEVIFVSGGSEANNWVVKSLCLEAKKKKEPFFWISTATEHSSLFQLIDWVRSEGGNVALCPVDRAGRIELNKLDELFRIQKCHLLSFSHANSETGTLQDLSALTALAKERGILVHVDACQSFLKTEIRFQAWNIDYLVLSAHKIHGPKGIGALVKKNSAPLVPLILGGGQESGLRAGTLNTEGIVGFGEAVSLYQNADKEHLNRLRKTFCVKLAEVFSGAVIQGDLERSVPSIINFRMPHIGGKKLMQLLSRKGIFVSTGSACDSGQKTPSRTLTAMGLSAEEALSSLRVSFSRMNTESELDIFFESLLQAIQEEKSGV
ncbi:MAG: cysteine desulfurase [Proteobacteria bacterium]|nr:cysteine desulfurase [Pseudomonadota bacterium]